MKAAWHQTGRKHLGLGAAAEVVPVEAAATATEALAGVGGGAAAGGGCSGRGRGRRLRLRRLEEGDLRASFFTLEGIAAYVLDSHCAGLYSMTMPNTIVSLPTIVCCSMGTWKEGLMGAGPGTGSAGDSVLGTSLGADSAGPGGGCNGLLGMVNLRRGLMV